MSSTHYMMEFGTRLGAIAGVIGSKWAGRPPAEPGHARAQLRRSLPDAEYVCCANDGLYRWLAASNPVHALPPSSPYGAVNTAE